MLLKLYRSNGDHVADLRLPAPFTYEIGGPYAMPPDAPSEARPFRGFRVTEDLGGEGVGDAFTPARKGIVIED